MSEKRKCCKELPGYGRFGWLHKRNCARVATVERGGAWYCCTHDPVQVKERDARRQATWDAEWKAESDERARKAEAERLTRELVAAIAQGAGVLDRRDTARRICELRGWDVE